MAREITYLTDVFLITCVGESGIADKIMNEPLGGTHQNYDKAALTLKNQIIDSINNIKE